MNRKGIGSLLNYNFNKTYYYIIINNTSYHNFRYNIRLNYLKWETIVIVKLWSPKMMKDIIKFFLLFLLSTFPCLAQNDNDSLSISLSKILETNIDGVSYVESASKYSQAIEDAPSSVTIITRKEIETYGYLTLPDLLNSQSGFYISNDRNYYYLGVRGFSRPTDYNNRVLLLIDGHRLNDYVYDSAPYDIHLSNFEKVEIIRGPGSALYGTSAMLAVINLVTKKSSHFLEPTINFNYGSFDTKNFSTNIGHQFNNSIKFSFNGTYTKSDGENLYFEEYNISDSINGVVNGRDYKEKFNLMSSFNYKNFQLNGFLYSYKKGVPTAPFETDFNSKVETIDQWHFLEAKIFHNFTYNSEISARVYYDQYYYWGVYPYDGEDSFDKDDAETFGSELKFIWDILPNNRIIAGIDYRNTLRADYKYWNESEVYTKFNVPSKSISIYLQDEFQLNSKLSFYFGLRNDKYLDAESALSPRIGIIYSPWELHTFKLLYGKAFRAPNAYEKKYDDPLYGFKENPNGLSPESAYTSEFIWTYKINNFFSTNTSIYYYTITNLIDQVEDPLDNYIFFENNGITKAFGSDISIEGRFNYTSGVYLRYSYQHARNENSNSLTNSPSHLLKIGLFNKILTPINFSFEYNYGSNRITVYDTETNPIHLAKANIFTDQIYGHFKFSFSVSNLFNESIKYPGGWEHLQPSIIQNKRNYNLTLTCDL